MKRKRSEGEKEKECTSFLLQLKKGGVAKASGEGEKEKECTTERKSRRRRDEKSNLHLERKKSFLTKIVSAGLNLASRALLHASSEVH